MKYRLQTRGAIAGITGFVAACSSMTAPANNDRLSAEFVSDSAWSPVIAGSLIAWRRPGFSAGTGVVIHDLSTDLQRVLLDESVATDRPAVSTRFVAWDEVDLSDPGLDVDVFYHDLEEDRTVRLAEAGDQSLPVLHGDLLVWGMLQGHTRKLILRDLGTGTVRQVSSDAAIPVGADLSNEYVVWTDFRADSTDVYLFDLRTGEERALTSNPASQGNPAISGSTVVWTDLRSGDPDIYAMDVVTGVEERLTKDDARQTDPDVFGDWVAWADWGGGSHIRLRNLKTGLECGVQASSAPQFEPQLSEEYVVWWEDPLTGFEVYAARLPAPGATDCTN